ncbi:ribonuclease J [Alteromonas oceanisediminis]|uniref:ribonuclease J n=1 Tax=Alteromonas oceanisediminis TaxID=2836180 RepID=UPI001BD9FFD3|nr:ribonuclease J [Alteromonas oceanisediminis]MBT0587355.1 ribonuclease J [Alteromonas oceanisediminis]
MNLNLYGHHGQWLMVDCGITFDEPLVPGDDQRFRVLCADPSFIAGQKENLAGIVITHAHEDHIGALAHLWPRLQAPVYTTPFTAEVLRRKLAQTGLSVRVPIIEVDAGDSVAVGVFNITWLPITHSIPEPFAMTIATPVGTVFHTADWKIDPDPGIGQRFNSKAFEQLGSQNILAMVCDSTNALKAGHSISEKCAYEGLRETIAPLTGRVVVTCFASNVARLLALATIARQTGRYMAVLGRSLENMVSIARVTGYWPQDVELIDPSHLGYLPKEEVLAVATGSQGESRAALHRLAYDNHFALNLDGGDTVVFSAMVIPGNEQSVERLVRQFEQRNVNVILSESSTHPIHSSGHPCKDELKAMYQWVRPQIAIPVHGEAEHIEANARVARLSGVNKHFAGRNGDLYQLAPQPMLKRQAIKTGRVIVQAE